MENNPNSKPPLDPNPESNPKTSPAILNPTE